MEAGISHSKDSVVCEVCVGIAPSGPFSNWVTCEVSFVSASKPE